jgi:hypothetical protein
VNDAKKASREAANAERAKRRAPEFLAAGAAKNWQSLPEAARVYVWRRLEELHAAPAKRAEKLSAALGFANVDALGAFQDSLAPFARHASERGMTLAQYLAFFAANEAKARGGEMTVALKNLIAFAGLDPDRLGRGMRSLWARLHLPRFDAALAEIHTRFAARSLDLSDARQSIAVLAARAHEVGLVLHPGASRFEAVEAP